MPDGGTPTIWRTRAEVAELTQLSIRHLQDLEAQHHIPVLRAGRAVRYDDEALAALKDAIRCHSAKSAAPQAAPGTSSVRLPVSGSERLRARLIAASQKKNGRSAKLNSTVLPFSGRPR